MDAYLGVGHSMGHSLLKEAFMQKVTRNSYSLFQRKTGVQTIWYARFWDDELQAYNGKRFLGKPPKPLRTDRFSNGWWKGSPFRNERNRKYRRNGY